MVQIKAVWAYNLWPWSCAWMGLSKVDNIGLIKCGQAHVRYAKNRLETDLGQKENRNIDNSQSSSRGIYTWSRRNIQEVLLHIHFHLSNATCTIKFFFTFLDFKFN